MEEQPLRLQDEHGTVLSHLSLRRRHSAQDMAPLARLKACSWARADRSLSSRGRTVLGMAVGGVQATQGGDHGVGASAGAGALSTSLAASSAGPYETTRARTIHCAWTVVVVLIETRPSRPQSTLSALGNAAGCPPPSASAAITSFPPPGLLRPDVTYIPHMLLWPSCGCPCCVSSLPGTPSSCAQKVFVGCYRVRLHTARTVLTLTVAVMRAGQKRSPPNSIISSIFACDACDARCLANKVTSGPKYEDSLNLRPRRRATRA